MLSFIKGTIEYIYQDCFVIENEGLGYKIYTSLEVLGKLVLRENVKVFIYMSVCEDDISFKIKNTKEIRKVAEENRKKVGDRNEKSKNRF